MAASRRRSGAASAHLASVLNPALAAHISPLEALQLAVEAMEKGAPVPVPAARVLLPGLRMYLTGNGYDITRNLGLRRRPGERAPNVVARMEKRNRHLGVLVEKLGPKETLARLSAPDPASGITDGEVQRSLAALTSGEFAGDLPTSERTLYRIAELQG